MIEIVYSRSFLKDAKHLPAATQTKLADVIVLLSIHPFDTRLHTKKLSGELTGYFSCRITRDWRVIFLFHDKDTIELLAVGHRKDMYR
ncbi:MAG: hypothetical protein A3C90_04610 [Candidatus Magasanikbacteria bacterium RIFCSPHIGHO2_02_FULL_51_14]|uniref:Toxin YoeB n=1 Tax=Candidatus Magasanikbacteria bacterium RIFCSPHIGHO2_02_FULL_51_14 TaxID=1798683 RepID=A0A1F6MQG0_9BACT|nr:MAG: hypothetical protein A3C90_04610 [Candidatus Magasanikbacteria bacterium RIFCSPHIGHO2_02_FULL_51_14]